MYSEKGLGPPSEIVDISVSNGLLSNRKGDTYMQAYCMKCRAKREMNDAKNIIMKNGNPAPDGVCPICGTRIFRIGKS